MVVLASALLAAGCVTPEEGPVEAASTAPTPDAASEASVNAERVAETTPTIILTTVAYSGTTPTGACFFLAGTCEFATEGTEDYHILTPPGQPQRLTLSIAYGAQQPGMDFCAALCAGETEGESSFDVSGVLTSA